MARWSYLIVAVYVLLAVGYAQDANSNETTTTPVVPDTTTSQTTTTATTTTTSTKPTTTTTATTSKTTTAPTTTTSTTPATTKASTTTAKPEPQPDFPRNVGKWLVNGTGKSADVTCLALSAALEVTAVYKDDNNATQTVHEIVPTTATSSGTCADDEVSVTITGGNVTLTLTFSRNKTSQQSALSEIEVNVTLPNLSNVAVTLENQTLFEAPLNKSYKCTKETSVKLGDEVNLRVASLQVEAFRQTAFDNYSAALECAIDDVSPVVPLAVGISLAVLVVIVLIAYLIGRSRSRARGYQSV